MRAKIECTGEATLTFRCSQCDWTQLIDMNDNHSIASFAWHNAGCRDGVLRCFGSLVVDYRRAENGDPLFDHDLKFWQGVCRLPRLTLEGSGLKPQLEAIGSDIKNALQRIEDSSGQTLHHIYIGTAGLSETKLKDFVVRPRADAPRHWIPLKNLPSNTLATRFLKAHHAAGRAMLYLRAADEHTTRPDPYMTAGCVIAVLEAALHRHSNDLLGDYSKLLVGQTEKGGNPVGEPFALLYLAWAFNTPATLAKVAAEARPKAKGRTKKTKATGKKTLAADVSEQSLAGAGAGAGTGAGAGAGAGDGDGAGDGAGAVAGAGAGAGDVSEQSVAGAGAGGDSV